MMSIIIIITIIIIIIIIIIIPDCLVMIISKVTYSNELFVIILYHTVIAYSIV